MKSRSAVAEPTSAKNFARIVLSVFFSFSFLFFRCWIVLDRNGFLVFILFVFSFLRLTE